MTVLPFATVATKSVGFPDTGENDGGLLQVSASPVISKPGQPASGSVITGHASGAGVPVVAGGGGCDPPHAAATSDIDARNRFMTT